MVKNKIYRISQWLMMACLVMTMVSCRETIESIFSDDIAEGDEVMFTAALPRVAMTRAESDYEVVNEPYQFTIGMYTSEENKVAEGTYKVIENDAVGTLNAATPLYWPSTTVAYGFKAVAGTKTLDADQSEKDKWLLQDRLEGSSDSYRTAKEWKDFNEM